MAIELRKVVAMTRLGLRNDWAWAIGGRRPMRFRRCPKNEAMNKNIPLVRTDPFMASPLGYVFLPAIYCDRRLAHRDLDLVNTNDERIIFGDNGEPKWNPVGAKIVEEEREAEALKMNSMVLNIDMFIGRPCDYDAFKWKRLIGVTLLRKYGANAVNVLSDRRLKISGTNYVDQFKSKQNIDIIIQEIKAIGTNHYE